jgi:GNAT superfamily N-acetyltransferase
MPACIEMFSVVHERDGYPIYLPDDLGAFVTTGDELGAWVASEKGSVLGHVALHPRSWDGAMRVACTALGCRDDAIAVVARLAVSPSVRRRGVGHALLECATHAAVTRGRRPILDVAAHYADAIRLYHAAGWLPLGKVAFPLPDGTAVDEVVFAGPAANRAAGQP